MHAICVTCGVFQAGEGSTANLEGTVETARHICCGQKNGSSVGTLGEEGVGVTVHSMGTNHDTSVASK